MYRGVLLVFLIVFISSCIGNKEKTGSAESEHTQPLITNNDSVKIIIDSFSLVYTKQEFQLITDSFPQLKGIDGIVEHPDSAYRKYPVYAGGYTFGSEAGQDEFYLLYAHFLRATNSNKNKEERGNLIKIYWALNEIYGELNRGGTYFGHVYYRIVGYVEYEIYCLSQDNEDNISSDFVKQKEKFISSIKKEIDKGIKELETYGTNIDKAQLQEYVKELNNMLTNEFYLSKAVNFKMKYYNFKPFA